MKTMLFKVGLLPNYKHGQTVVTLSLCIGLATMICSQSILASLSKNIDGQYDYNPTTVIFTAEILKLATSLILLLKEILGEPEEFFTSKWRFFPHNGCGTGYFLLALLYAIQNNALYFVLIYVDPGTFQILINLKLPLTAFLLHLLNGKQYSFQQKTGLVLLTLGATLSGSPSLTTIDQSSKPYGYILMGIIVCISGFAGVLNEIFLKNQNNGSLPWQNCQLYAWGCIFCLFKLLQDFNLNFRLFFKGYTWITAANVINLSSVGLVTSLLLKYSDNIVRSISGIISICLSNFISVVLLNVQLSNQSMAGLVSVGLGIAFYSEIFNPAHLSTYPATRLHRPGSHCAPP